MANQAETLSSAFEQGMGIFDNSATAPSSRDYFSDRGIQRNAEENKREERLIDLLQEIPKPTIGMDYLKNRLNGIVTVSDPRFEFDKNIELEITNAAETFIRHQKKSVKYRNEILKVADKASECLKKSGIDAEVTVDLFTDPEYSNWIEPKVRIIVGKEQLDKAYEKFDDLLEFAFSGISQKTLQRLSVTIDSRQ